MRTSFPSYARPRAASFRSATRSAARAAAAALLLCGGCVAGLSLRAFAGEPAPAGAAGQPAASAASLRLTAVESEIRHLERTLQYLRKARTELNAGRAEPVPSDDAAKRVREVDLRA